MIDWHWPDCPQCGTLRQTQCPVCGEAAAPFELAEHQELGEAGRGTRPNSSAEPEPPPAVPMLLCSTCDEPFRPVFYRHCHACGHDYGEGREAEAAWSAPNTARVGMAIAVLLLLAAALLVYFAALLR